MLSVAPSKKIILASTSPRRKDLLAMCGIQFDVVPSDVNEDEFPNEDAPALVERLSFAKAEVIAKLYPNDFVIGADTTVAVKDRILGKPNTAAEAISMLQLLRGKTHTVWGGFTILCGDRRATELCKTQVTFRDLSDQEIAAYVKTGEPMDKAGSYGAQGIGASFILKIEGSYTNVVGLPLAECLSALMKIGAVVCE